MTVHTKMRERENYISRGFRRVESLWGLPVDQILMQQFADILVFYSDKKKKRKKTFSRNVQ